MSLDLVRVKFSAARSKVTSIIVTTLISGLLVSIPIPANAATVATPATPILVAASDTGSSSTDKNTNDNTPTFSAGSLIVGATVTFTATPSSGSPVTCVITAASSTDTCTFTTLPDSTYSVAVKQTSGTVTSASPAPLTGVVIDTQRPTVTLSSRVASGATVARGANDLIARNTAIALYTFTVNFSEAVSGLLMSEITKDVASSGWELGATLSNSTGSSYTFTATNSSALVNSVGKLLLRIAEGVATDIAGNTNMATTTDFEINSIARVDFWDCGPIGQFCTGGTGPNSVTQASSGASITLPGPNTLYKTGYSFTGWSESQTGGSLLTGSYTPTTRIILFPQWTPSVYVVTFDANGGTGIPDSATVNYTYGTTGIAITSTYNAGTLAKTGYTFGGWSTTVSGAAVANPYVPAASLTLYARWTAGTFAITFDSNTATGGTMANLSITAGTASTLTANAYSKPGYTFNNWNTAANGTGTTYAAGASVTLYANTRLYAQWKPVAPGAPTVSAVARGNTTVTATVTPAAVSGTTSGAADSFTVQAYSSTGVLIAGKTCTVLASVSPLSCQITGLTNGTAYEFKATGYNSTGSNISASFSSLATPAPWTVIYNVNGATSGAIANGSYNLGTPLTLPTPTKTNYTFSGWYDTMTAGSLIGVGGASYSPSAETTTIYARWVGVSYTITYYANGATSGTVPAPGSFTAGGSAYSISGNSGSLARTGYTFGGWDSSTAGNGTSYAVNASYNSNANLNLYAKWAPIARTVSYAGTTSSGGLPAQLTNKYIGDTFTVSSSAGFARSGYAFTGWFDGTNLYAAGSTYTVGSTDVTLTAQWSAVSYSITYLANGGSGSLPTQANLSNSETFTVGSNSLTKTGYSFVAWNDGTANYAPGATYTMSAANTSLIAQWTATGYTITFNGNGADGGSAPTTGRYVTGGAPYSVALNTYTKTGYTFTGWKSAGNVDYAPGSGYAGTADLVLYAQWAPKVISISYSVNGGTGTTPSTTTWTYDSATATTLDSGSGLTKTGYTFGGWATSASATSGSLTATPSSSLTYYAVWTPVSYAITYTAGTNGTGTVPTQTGKTLGSTFTLASGGGLSRPDESGVSFLFAYWSDGGTTYAPGATFLMPARDVTLIANWIAIYNVTYNANGGVTNNASVQKTESATVTIGDAPTRVGYTFGKWVAQSGEQFEPGASTTVQNDRYLFTATWTAIPRSVTYDLNGGSGSAPSTTTGKTIGQIVTLDSTTATKAGYTFGGWSIGGTTYPAGASYTIANADVAPTAVWVAATYAITYNGNGATSGSAPSGGTFTTGGSYTASANTSPLAKTGFTFVGWNTSANGGGTDYAENATTVTTTADLILYAKWSAASYSITYVLNGATSSLPTQANVQFGSTFTVAAAATQADKTFTGWSDNTNTYGGGSTYTMGGSAVTLTATWANQLYAITYSLNGGTGASAPIQIALASTDTFTVQTTSATKSGYSFGGWSNGTNTYQANATYNMTSDNVTLTAIWNIAAPGTPGTPTIVAGDGNATISVVAPTTGGVPTSYTVTASPGGATCTVISPATSCTITGLNNGTSYSFSTVANNAIGSSSASPSSAAVSPAGKPGVPTGVTATIGNGSATVSLTPPTNTGGSAITSYTMTASPGGASCTVNSPATSCAISPLTNGTAYTFTATAFNGVARSDSSTASASVTPATVPDAPTITSASSSSSGSTTVNFSAPASNGGSAITGYTITSNPGGFTCTAAANATSCAVSGLTDGVAYTFTAVATNAIGNSSSSGASSAVTSAGAPSAPTSVTATVGNGSSTVSVSGASANGSAITSYTVQAYDSTGAALAGKTCTITSPATSCAVSGLTNGTGYTFTATATNGVGTSAASAPSAAITPAGVPSAPSGITVTSGTGKVTVAWTAPAANGSPIISYTAQAYDADGNAVSGATCTISAPSTTCDVTSNLVAGSNYTFKVTATSAAGTSSASTASPSAAINSAPSAPLSVTATAGNSSATVSWNAPANTNGSAITSYTATAIDSNGNPAGTCTAAEPATTCVVTGLTNGGLYTFKVTATNGIGTSADSVLSTPAVKPSTVPNAPTGLTVASGDGSVTVSFTAPTNNGGSTVTGYTVTASDGATISGSSSPLTIADLTNGTAYTFTVKATNINGDSVASATSASSTPVASNRPTLANPGQPTGDPYVGSTLTSNVTFNGSPTPVITYQWKVCTDPLDLSTCTNISGATSATFTPTISELGKYIVVAATATNRVGTLTETSVPTLVINPEIAFTAPGSVPAGTVGSAYVLSLAAAGGVGSFGYTVSNGTPPAGLTLNPTTGQISGTPTTAGTYTFTVRATDSNGVYKDVVVTIVVAAATTTPVVNPPTEPPAPTCDSACQASKDAAATKAAADKAAADAATKAAADAKITADAAAAKAAANTAATAASTKAAADAAAAAAAAKAAVDKAAAAAVAQAAADAAAAAAAAKAKAAADAQAIAAKTAADAAAALKNATSSAAAKAASTASANAAAAAVSAAVKAAASAAQQAATAKATAANATKQVDIAINSLTLKTASSQASAQANAIAAAAKAAANEAAAAAAAKASEAKASATAAQKAAADTAARIATEQKQAADAAAQAKIAADAAAKATADKVAADAAATKAAQDLAKVLADKAALAEQAAKTTDETARAEIEKKIDEVTTKVEEVQKSVEVATTKAEAATTVQVAATQSAESATKEAQTQAAEAVAVKTESVANTAAATKAVAAATVAAKVAVAAKEAAATVPSMAVIPTKPSTSTNKNSATATVTGLKPGQKVKVIVNVKDK